MGTKVRQPPDMGLGWAEIRVRPIRGLDPSRLQISIERDGNSLQTNGIWGASQGWLSPDAASIEGEEIVIALGEQFTWGLKANVAYLMRLRNGTDGQPIEERLPWPALRMPGVRPERSPIPVAASHVPPIAPAPQPPAPVSETTIRRPVTAPLPPDLRPPVLAADRPRRLFWLVSFVFLVLLAASGAGAWWWWYRPPVAPQLASPTTMPEARRIATEKHSADEYYAEAERFMAGGDKEAVSGAELLYSVAGDVGSTPAAVAMGHMLDPDLFVPAQSAFAAPNAAEAALWYSKAAANNDPEALYRLGVLVQSGRARIPPDKTKPADGLLLLRRAARLGSKPAQETLAKLGEKN